MFVRMTVSHLNRIFLEELSRLYSRNEAAQITSIAFESLAGIRRADVIKDPGMLISDNRLQFMENALLRLKAHEPIQHITGQTWFCNLAFKVSPAVLIPRPETEELVMLVSAFINDQRLGILDIGTGSGCIPIALAVKNKHITVSAIDISEEALEIARHNAYKHACTVDFIQRDFLDEGSWTRLVKTDIIVSNPPYIPPCDEKLLDKNVSRYEPHIALFEPAGQPLIFYHKIAKFGKSHLNAKGRIFLEIHEDFGKDVLDIFINAGYKAELKIDMFGKERFVEAK